MGSLNSCQVMNNSNLNLRVYVTDKPQKMDAFVVSKDGSKSAEAVASPGGKKFTFKNHLKCTHVLPAHKRDVPWSRNHCLTVFVEDDDDDDICYKTLLHNVPLPSPLTVVVYNII